MSVSAWLTPDSIPGITTCRVLLIPDSEEIVAAISGALLLLSEAENWEAFGSVTPEEIASAMWGMWREFVDGGCMRVGDLRASLRSGDHGDCWLVCDGGIYDVADFPLLYDEIGNSFGGAAPLTFAVPDLRGRAVAGATTGKPAGTLYGEAAHTLSVAELPGHSHTEQGVVATPTAIGEIPSTGLAPVGNSSGITGGGNPHNNVPPSMAVTWLIKAK